MTNLATTEATLTDVESLLGKKKHEQRLGYTVWVIQGPKLLGHSIEYHTGHFINDSILTESNKQRMAYQLKTY